MSVAQTSPKGAKMLDMKILLVDDEKFARSMAKDMVKEMGITQVFEAENGKVALEFLDDAADFVDIIMCDWNMPTMTGVEFLRQVRSVYPDMPFLMVTGRGDVESIMEAKKSGVTAYVKKPFSAVQLEAKLRIVAARSGLV